MSQQLIRAALDTRLSTLPGLPPVAWEGEDYAPVQGVTYAKVALLPRTPSNRTLTEQLQDNGGVYQIGLYFPRGTPTGTMDALAGTIQQHFAAGTSLSAGIIGVRIEGTPAIAAGFPTGDRWLVPVSIRYRSIF
jgi:hypothetical protein